MKKRVLFIQLKNYHTEILGFFTWCLQDAEFFLFYPFKNSVFNFKNYLSHYVNITEVEEIGLDYDLYIFLTGRDVSKKQVELLEKHNKKVIQGVHHIDHDKVYSYPMSISFTKLIQGDDIHSFLPVHNYCTTINHEPRKVLSVIGLSYANTYMKDTDDLQKLARRLEGTEFKIHIYSRKYEGIAQSFAQYEHVKFFDSPETEKMIQQIKQDYFTLTLARKGGPYYKDILAGTIPLSMNTNVPMIMHEKLNEIYNIEGAFTYRNSIIEIIDSIIQLPARQYRDNLFDFFQYKKEICEMNREYLLNLLECL